MSVADMNFLPKHNKRWYQKSTFYIELALFAALLALIIVYGFYKPLKERQQQSFLVDAVKYDLENYNAKKISNDEMDKRISECEHRWENVRNIMKCTPKEWIDVISNIENWLDGSVKISSYICDGNTVSLTGTGSSDTEVARLAKELENSNIYYDISIKSIAYYSSNVTFQMSGKIAWEVDEHE